MQALALSVLSEGPNTVTTADEVFRQHAATMHRWVTRLGGPGFDVDDALQDAFVVVHQQVHRFVADEAKLTTWLYAVVQNVVRHHRRKSRANRLSQEDPTGAIEAAVDERTPHEALERSRSQARLYDVLDQLSERDRTVLILFELEGLSGEAIAQLLDAKVNTVWVWVHRAKARFLAKLSEHDDEMKP